MVRRRRSADMTMPDEMDLHSTTNSLTTGLATVHRTSHMPLWNHNDHSLRETMSAMELYAAAASRQTSNETLSMTSKETLDRPNSRIQGDDLSLTTTSTPSLIRTTPNSFLTMTTSSSEETLTDYPSPKSPPTSRLRIHRRDLSRSSISEPNPSENNGKTMNVFKELIQTAAEKDKELKGSPPLNLFTTLPKNFTRFVLKVGPLANFQDKIESILFWQVPTGQSIFLYQFFLFYYGSFRQSSSIFQIFFCFRFPHLLLNFLS
jgi:hypothetical protein